MAESAPNAKAVFDRALEIESPAAREAYLEQACAGDAALREKVEGLLQAYAGASSFLETAAPVAGDAPGPTADYHDKDERAGAVIAGKYTLVEVIGEGGMGSVWRAKQSEPIKRFVAVKLIKAGMDSKQVLARFEAERQALAMMDHPNIAKVLDGGLHERRPYFVMELVKGAPITEYCDARKLTPKERLELFVPVCQALQHAHQKGIIHRDIKPTNVLVALYDDKPVVKVIDFGVAKATGGTLTEQTIDTGFGGVVGTPEYMSPEQATFNNLDVDTRSDVYALGALLYELLTGSPPFSSKELEKRGLLEILRVVREEEPPRPSTKLSTADALASISANRGTEPKKLTGLLRNELDWIVMKALEKDRARRYETANGFAADVQRYLSGEAVLAHPPSTGYRLKKFVKRHKGQVIAASLVLVTLLAGIVGSSLGLLEARRQAGVAEAEKRKAEEAEASTLADYRASTDDAIEQLIGSKPEYGLKEKTYLEKTLERWKGYAARQGDDERSRTIRGEGHYRVALLWKKLGRRKEALVAYQTARGIQRELAEQFPAVPTHQQDLARTLNNLANVLADFGRSEEARTEYMAARDLQKQLVLAFPAVPERRQELARTHNNLATLLRSLGKPEEAQLEHRAAYDLAKNLVEQFPAVQQYKHLLAFTHNNQGNLFGVLGMVKEARLEHLAARDLAKELVAASPTVPVYLQEVARSHNHLGILHRGLGEGEEARAEYMAARDLRRNLVVQYPAVPTYQQELAGAHNNLGVLLNTLGQREGAQAEFMAARDLQKKLAEQFLAVQEYQEELAFTHNNLANLLVDLGKREEARAEYSAARDLLKKLTIAFPAVRMYQVGLGNIYCNHGMLINKEGKPTESLEWFDLAIRTLQPVHDQEPRDSTAKQFLRNSHLGRAEACDQLKRPAEAVKNWDSAVELSPPTERPILRASRASSRVRSGQVAEAVAEIAELVKSPNLNAGQSFNFACTYAVASGKVADKKQEYADRAMALLHQAVAAGFKDATHMKKDTDLDPLREREDFKKLMKDLEAKAPKK